MNVTVRERAKWQYTHDVIYFFIFFIFFLEKPNHMIEKISNLKTVTNSHLFSSEPQMLHGLYRCYFM